MKKYVFFYHYNKPLSIQRGKPTITVHYRNECLIVNNIICNVPTEGKINKSQPVFVIRGKSSNLVIVDDVAIIN
jgi:hypothetical protein